MASFKNALLPTFIALLLIGCATSNQLDSSKGLTDSYIHSSLSTNVTDSPMLDAQNEDQFVFPMNVRPCCALGMNQKVKVLGFELPWFRVHNIIQPDELGEHIFNVGMLGVEWSSTKSENNGLIYTYRGGVVDTAHVRDTADMTVALFQRIYPNLDAGSELIVEGELGEKRFYVNPIDTSKLQHQQKWYLAADIAARLAWYNAALHEFGQAHGYRSLSLYPELVSAYSPEDLYSNAIGAKIAVGLIKSNLAADPEIFARHMTDWLRRYIDFLVPANEKEIAILAKAADKIWWDSEVALPSKYHVLRRNYSIDTVREPLKGDAQFMQQFDQRVAAKISKYDDAIVKVSIPTNSYAIDLGQVSGVTMQIDKVYLEQMSYIPHDLLQGGVTDKNLAELAKYDQQFFMQKP